MNFKEILELIDKVAQSGIGSVEVEQAGTKVRIAGKSAAPQYVHSSELPRGDAPPQYVHLAPATPAAAQAGASGPQPGAEEENEAGLHIITAPIVGTFYRAPNPEADPYISVGDRISKGQVICIVEAMKLMNEIESDIEGVITRIYPQNGQPVEYGEKLFAVRV